ncbi:MAG: phage tail protein [Coriobacteriaceae bacterium]|nr:phage tail protein [Coriobacteriaceae bacterium]
MSIVKIESVGDRSLERVNKILSTVPNGVYKATYSALKRAGQTAKTQAGRFAAAEYTINKSTFMSNVNQKQHITGSSGGVTSMTITFAGSVLPLLTFNTKYSRSGLVQTQVKRSGGATTLQHAFVANIGKFGVYERVGRERYPVEGKYGPSTGHMMQNEDVVEQMEKVVEETYENRIEHEITRVLNGFGG